MYHLFSPKRCAPHTPGHHGPKTAGEGGFPQPGEAAPERGLSPEPVEDTRRLGYCLEPARSRRQDAVPGSHPGASSIVSQSAAASAPRRPSERFGRRAIRGGSEAMKSLTLALIRFYQICLSPVMASSCRYYPSCSRYAYEAVDKWGAWHGAMMVLRRLLRCRPLGGHGYDPVP